VSSQLVRAFEEVDSGTPQGIRRGSNMIADYEQRSVIQNRIYANERYREAFEANEWWSKRRLGRWMGARPAELPLSPTCGAGPNVPFRGSITDPDARVNYYHELMNRYERRPELWRQGVGRDIIRQAGGP